MTFVTVLSSSSSSRPTAQLAETKSNNKRVCISNNNDGNDDDDDDEIDQSASATEVSYSTTTSTAEDNASNNIHLIVHANNSITEITGAQDEKEANINVNATATSNSSSYLLGAKQSAISIPLKAEDDPAPKATFQLQDFKRHKILGEGMFGQVWLASCANNSSENENDNDSTKPRHQPHCDFYALKIQSKFELAMEGQIENAIREKEIMSKLQQQQHHHPFLSNLIDTFQDESFVYLVLDLVQGGELFSLLHNMDTGDSLRLPETQARFYALCLADALAYLHSLMVVYRDLKPENVMIDDKGYPVLVDFGNAKVLGGSGNCPSGSRARTLCGTPAYCSPEMIRGEGYDYSTDYWSLGIILHEMLLGGHPFYYDYNNDGGTMDQMALFEAIVEDEYTHPSPPDGISISPEVMDLMSRLLVKDPIQRLGCQHGSGGGIRRRKHDGSDENDIFAHAWWLLSEGEEAIIMEDYMDALRRNEITAPWIPAIGKQDPLGAGCFDDWDHLQDKTVTEYPLVEPKDARKFHANF